jgi:hypothetical protein
MAALSIDPYVIVHPDSMECDVKSVCIFIQLDYGTFIIFIGNFVPLSTTLTMSTTTGTGTMPTTVTTATVTSITTTSSNNLTCNLRVQMIDLVILIDASNHSIAADRQILNLVGYRFDLYFSIHIYPIFRQSW